MGWLRLLVAAVPYHFFPGIYISGHHVDKLTVDLLCNMGNDMDTQLPHHGQFDNLSKSSQENKCVYWKGVYQFVDQIGLAGHRITSPESSMETDQTTNLACGLPLDKIMTYIIYCI